MLPRVKKIVFLRKLPLLKMIREITKAKLSLMRVLGNKGKQVNNWVRM
jgi:hypothetical protein